MPCVRGYAPAEGTCARLLTSCRHMESLSEAHHTTNQHPVASSLGAFALDGPHAPAGLPAHGSSSKPGSSGGTGGSVWVLRCLLCGLQGASGEPPRGASFKVAANAPKACRQAITSCYGNAHSNRDKDPQMRYASALGGVCLVGKGAGDTLLMRI